VIANLVIGVLGVAALGLCATMVARHLTLEWTPSGVSGEPRQTRMADAAQRLSATLAAGFVAGALVVGVGGRFFMRVVGATSGDSAQGRLTEASEVVGRVTIGGSVFFFFFGAGIGVLGAAGLYLFRAWLPLKSVTAGVLGAGVGAGLLARPTDLLAPESIDFEILGPRWFAVGFAVVLILLLGTTTCVLADRWVQRWPKPALSIRGVCGLLPLLPLILSGPGGVIIPVLLAGRTVWPERRQVDSTPKDRVIAAVLIVVAAAGWMWTLAAGVEIVF
jgi:hypothetical protein